ncbi:hypothetical protein VU03_05020, partial [Desulfobulbus sp. N3]|nr:hypothetical protein [Desulfobulbus sp. N3]
MTYSCFLFCQLFEKSERIPFTGHIFRTSASQKIVMQKRHQKTEKKRTALLLKRILPLAILLLTGAFFYGDLAKTNKINQLVSQDTL